MTTTKLWAIAGTLAIGAALTTVIGVESILAGPLYAQIEPCAEEPCEEDPGGGGSGGGATCNQSYGCASCSASGPTCTGAAWRGCLEYDPETEQCIAYRYHCYCNCGTGAGQYEAESCN